MTLFRAVDIAVLTSAMTDRLRVAGIDVGLSSTHRFAEALAACPPTSTGAMYWVARVCFVSDPAQLDRFDAIFAAIFDSDGLPIRPKERNIEPRMPTTTGTLLKQSSPVDGLAAAQGRFVTDFRPALGEDAVVEDPDGDDDRDETALPEIYPSEIAALVDEPFDQLSAADLDIIGAWIERAATEFLCRPSRRLRQAKQRGAIDLRRTLRRSRSTYGEPVRVLRHAPTTRPRRVVMIGDVSGSMQSFTRVYLHLMRALVINADAEVFTFATSLRRATVQLRDKDPQAAIDRLSNEVTDRFSGTRIGVSLSELVASPVWSTRVRGAIVVIASDGWEADAQRGLDQAMRRLQRLARRVVWVNPRAGAEDFEPLTTGMAQALPYVDALHSGHSLRTMHEVIASLSAE